jgi:hypothetical protein
MGLDMYAMITTEALPAPVDFKAKDAQELFYWRKHPNLHGWMRELYYAKGGTAQSFNLVPVSLSLEDLDELEVTIREGALPQTMGFFFGYSDGDEKEDDLYFIAKAREAIAAGYTVYYDSWW